MTKHRNEFKRKIGLDYEFICHDCPFRKIYRTKKLMFHFGQIHRQTVHGIIEPPRHVRPVLQVIHQNGAQERVNRENLINP